MKERKKNRVLGILAMAVLIIGTLMTVRSSLRTDTAVQRLEKKVADLSELRAMQSEAERYTRARKAFEQLPEKKLTVIASLVDAAFPGRKADDMRETRVAAAGGWTLVQNELSLDDIPLAGAMDLIRRAENSRPPWRLTKCVIRSSVQEPGNAKVVLLFEGLEKVGE